jgi:pilus assembly protein CpaB
MKNPKAFLFALLLACLATFAQCRYVANREAKLLYQSEMLATLVAIKDIPEDFKLDETMVDVIQVPRKWRQPKALSAVEDILGQISSNPIIEGEQISYTKLVKPDDAGLAFFVPKKLRAVALAVDQFNAVGLHIKPYNYVDIVGTFDFGQGEKADTRTVTLFQNVWVLSVGDDIGQPTMQVLSDESSRSVRREKRSGATVTLALRPDEAQKLILAQRLGDLNLTLRSLWETERFVELEHASIHSTLGIPQRVRYTKRASYRVISSGGF